MARLNIIVEGHSEEAFVNTLLAPHLAQQQVYAAARRVETSREKSKRARKTAKIFRGGVIDYRHIRKDVATWMKQDQDRQLYFTTMFDLYALPEDFPGWAEAAKLGDLRRRVEALEAAWLADIPHPRFIPYLQLHEFEALILADLARFGVMYEGREQQVEELARMCASFSSPELINDDPLQAPSKRIIQLFPDYGEPGGKRIVGPLLAAEAGLPTIRGKCPHFDVWLSRLEGLAC